MIRKLFAAALLIIPTLCGAVQAYRTPQIFTQPDGSQVTLSQRGDEFFHYYLTDDGQMVVSNGEGYYFAQPDASGLPAASHILATDPTQRTQQQAKFLQGINAETMVAEGAKVGNAKRIERQATYTPQFRSQAPQAASSTWPSGIGLFPNNSYPVKGSPKALIILVQYKDKKFTYPNAKEYFTNLASQKGFSESNAHGSALDYFTASSNGQFTPDFDVLGPVTLNNNMSYYGGNDYNGNDLRPAHMIRDAIQMLNSTTDFSVYDTDGDGVIDNVYCIYAGQGEASGGSSSTIWPHSWNLTSAGLSLTVDGKKVYKYACSAEYLTSSLVDGIGTFCHEFSHVMGLPDLYTTTYNSYQTLTPSSYSLMDYGSYSNNSRTPPTYSIYERNSMGWADLEQLKPGVPHNGSLEHMLKSNKGYVIATEKTNEFFLLENRQRNDWDAYLPGHGMLVWHIDYNTSVWNSNSPNNQEHQYVDIVEAGGTANNTSASTMAKYPFPGTAKVSELTSTTTPALKSWSGTAIDVPLTNITETSDGLITFDVCGGVVTVVDKPICNFTDDVVESEEPVAVILSLPATAEEADKIIYKYVNNDDAETVGGTYTDPIDIAKSCVFEFWTDRNGELSEVTTINFYIGEKAPIITTYSIVYRNNSSDVSLSINPSSRPYDSEVEEGAEIATYNASSSNYIYGGTYGLKFSSSKNNGSLVLDISGDYQKPVIKVVINAKSYGMDSPTLSVNGSEAQTIATTPDDYTFVLDGAELKQLTLSATKRLYVKSITLYATDSVDPGVDPDDPVVDPTNDYSHRIVFNDGGNEGTAITSDNFGSRCIEGDDILTVNGDITRVFYGTDGIKFGSSKGGGEINFDITSPYQKPYTSVVVNARSYGSDNSSLTVNGTSLLLGASLDDYSFKVPLTEDDDPTDLRKGATTLTQLSLSSDKRLYIKSITLKFEKDATGVAQVEADFTDAQPEYYNLQGIRIAEPAKGQLYIVRQGTKVTKAIVR